MKLRKQKEIIEGRLNVAIEHAETIHNSIVLIEREHLELGGALIDLMADIHAIRKTVSAITIPDVAKGAKGVKE